MRAEGHCRSDEDSDLEERSSDVPRAQPGPNARPQLRERHSGRGNLGKRAPCHVQRLNHSLFPMEEGTKSKKTVFVGGIGDDVDENVIYTTFAPFGLCHVSFPALPPCSPVLVHMCAFQAR